MSGHWTRWRVAGVASATVLLGALLLLLGANLALNVAVHRALNQHPERLRVDFAWAWTWFPGHVVVHGLEIDVDAPDHWVLTADRAQGWIDLRELRQRRFVARDLRASGVAFRFRPREPSEPTPERARAPWTVTLEDVVLTELREVALADYRFVGRATTEGTLAVGDALELHARSVIEGGDATRGGDVLARSVAGDLAVDVVGLDPRAPLTLASLGSVNAHAALAGQSEDLGFLSYYLASAPWFGIRGAATVATDVTLDRGLFRSGSWLTAETTGLAVRFGDLDARGDGHLRLEVEEDAESGRRSRLSVHYGAFTISDHSPDPLVVGTGLEVTGVSPDTDLLRPLESLDVTFDLPPSTVPDAARFDRYLPADVGLAILGGRGTVSGHLVASAEGARVSGEALLDARRIRLGVGDVRITTDLALRGKLARGHLGEGRYDFSGTHLSVTHLALADPSRPDETGAWWAELDVQRGRVNLSARDHVDATLALECANALPILQVLAEIASLPEWVRDRLPRVPDLAGTARIRLGKQRVTVDPLAVSGRGAELRMRWLQVPAGGTGEVLAGLGALTVALEVTPNGTTLHPFDPRRWFGRPRTAPFGTSARAPDDGGRTAEVGPEVGTDEPARAARR